MPRNIPLGNGALLVCFDCRYQLRDLYYPHVGQENHTSGRGCRMGVWIDDRLSWVHDEGWTQSLDYEDDTLVGCTELRNPDLQLELHGTDAVDFTSNVYLRHLVVRNLVPRRRTARIYFHQDFGILGNDIGDTAYFDPATRAMIHYKGARYFLANVCGPNACGIGSFATGLKNRPGFEGTWRDAEDGHLSGNPIAQGAVDSTLEIEVELEAGGEASMHYWIIAGQTYDEVLALDRQVLLLTPDELIRRTRDYWHCWVNKERLDFADLPPDVVRLFKRSLLVIRTQVDDHGPILAANDSDYVAFSRDTYSYCWPRDGALVSRALDLAGYGELTRTFFEFCARVLRQDGYLMHKYNPDGTVASSWHPWINTFSRLPIQEDESALVLWALWEHYAKYRDIEFIRPLYKPLIVAIAEFLVRYRDAQSGLPQPSWDLWEERCGVHAFTCGAVHGGLKAASRFARMFGEAARGDRYEETAAALRLAMDERLYDPGARRFARALMPGEPAWTVDLTPDSSAMGLWAFGAYPVDDPRIVETQRQVEAALTVASSAGGMARYAGDPYFRTVTDSRRATGNPWFISTLWVALYRAQRARTIAELENEVRPVLEWVARHALASGVLAEQIHPETGEPLSVSPLTWSHAAFIEGVMRYLERRRALTVCPACGRRASARERD